MAKVSSEASSTPLLNEESEWNAHMSGIVTITFLKGDVGSLLKRRLVEIARANPWLCG